MSDVLTWLFDVDGFSPHGFCLAWNPAVLVAQVSADTAIAVSYLSVAVTIATFARLRGDLVFPWIFRMIAIVFALCGIVHLSDLAIIWLPVYDVQTVLKIGAGLSSVATAIGLWWLLPRALALPSPAALRAVNQRLECEVAERSQAEREALLARERAERASAAKTEFLAVMSHELRTPLTAILGFSDQLRHTLPEAAEAKRYASIICSSGNHLLNLINDVLDFSRIDAGHLQLQMSPVVVQEAVETSRAMVEAAADAKTVTVTADLAPDLPILYADEQRLRQVLINLLSNAVKFTPAGGSVTIGARRASANEVELTVADTGIGMAAEDIPRALETFQQLDNSLARSYGGVGLGLPLANALVALHRGRLTIASEPGKGTTVSVALPIGGPRACESAS